MEGDEDEEDEEREDELNTLPAKGAGDGANAAGAKEPFIALRKRRGDDEQDGEADDDEQPVDDGWLGR